MSAVSRTSFELTVVLRMVLDSRFSCLPLPFDEITGVHDHTKLIWCHRSNPELCAHLERTLYTMSYILRSSAQCVSTWFILYRSVECESIKYFLISDSFTLCVLF